MQQQFLLCTAYCTSTRKIKQTVNTIVCEYLMTPLMYVSTRHCMTLTRFNTWPCMISIRWIEEQSGAIFVQKTLSIECFYASILFLVPTWFYWAPNVEYTQFLFCKKEIVIYKSNRILGTYIKIIPLCFKAVKGKLGLNNYSVPWTRVLLLTMMNLSHVPVERVFRAEDDLTVGAVQLLRPFMNLRPNEVVEVVHNSSLAF